MKIHLSMHLVELLILMLILIVVIIEMHIIKMLNFINLGATMSQSIPEYVALFLCFLIIIIIK